MREISKPRPDVNIETGCLAPTGNIGIVPDHATEIVGEGGPGVCTQKAYQEGGGQNQLSKHINISHFGGLSQHEYP